jgi:endonuclease/exonuclease/phosphatase family metal-dependent hydrolase
LRLVTWNVQHGRRADGVVDVALVARCCAALAPDVLALQEVDVGAARSGRFDMVAKVAEATGMAATFAPALDLPGGGRYGNALLVRGALEDVEVLRLPGGGEPRVAVLARAAGVTVAATHLGLAGVAELQLPAITDALNERPPPRALLGDLNLERPDVEGLDLVDRGGPTFPALRPRIRIDHVALLGLLPDAVVVPRVPVSDHRPLVVEVG